MRPATIGLLVLAASAAGLLAAEDGDPGFAPPYFVANLAYSEPMVFDYDRDGVLDRVEFWVHIQGHPAVGEPGTPGHVPEAGSLSYFVYDLERKKKVENWLIGFNMGFPVAEKQYDIETIQVTGREARFVFQDAAWTLTDGGSDVRQDAIQIKDQRGSRDARFFGGDVRVVSAAAAAGPVDIAANQECNGCHTEAATSMAAGGGPHRDLDCVACHTQHPPEHAGAVPLCSPCHEGHDKSMSATSCVDCHRSHAAGEVSYANTVPSASCAGCHAAAATALRESKSLHMGLGCALCHQGVHGGEARTCVFCHRGTHPQHVMTQPASCVKCHGSAHSIDRGRAE